MAQTVKLAFSTLIGILGWHGVFLLLLIIAFKLFLWEQYANSCPCTWNVAYGTIMLLFPSLTCYMIAVFAYFRQDDDSAPWKVLKKFYEIKFACPYYDERTELDFHAEHCIKCRQLRRDWSLVKITVSIVFSFLFPLVWLSLSFLQTAYYVCAHVGPTSDTLINICDVTILNLNDYNTAFGLAIIRSKTVGSILFVCTLFFVGVFLILYGEITNYLSKKFDWDPSGKGARNNLQVQICIQPRRSSGSAGETESVHSHRDTPIPIEAAENERLSPTAIYGSNRAITINVSSMFAEALQDCLQEGAWQGIDIRCSQQEESGNRPESHTPPFHGHPRVTRRLQQQTGEHSYESLPPVT